MLVYQRVKLITYRRSRQGIFRSDPSHHIRNVIIPASPSKPQQPIQQPYVKRTSKINHPQNHWLVVQ